MIPVFKPFFEVCPFWGSLQNPNPFLRIVFIML